MKEKIVIRERTTFITIFQMVLLSLMLLGFLWTSHLKAAYVRTSAGLIPQPMVAVENVCAWPNLTLLDDGTIAAALFDQPNHGTTEGDVAVWTSTNHGDTWQFAGNATQHDPNTNRMNHAAGLATNGDLLVIASGWSNDPPSGFRSGILDPWLCRSNDNGQTWSIDKTSVPNVSPRGYPVIPYGDIAEGTDGSLRVVVYDWPGYAPRDEKAYVMSSLDGGYTWGNFSPLDLNNVRNETALFNLGGDNWMATARAYPNLDLYQYTSSDNGYSWQSQGPITGYYEHPGHLMRMQDGKILLTYSDRYTDPERGVKGIEILVSEDEGATWRGPMRVMDHMSLTGDDGGYPSSVQLPDGQILTSYYAEAIDGYSGYHMGVIKWDPVKSLEELNPTLVLHSGSNDPLSEGFSLNDADATSAWNDAMSAPAAGRLTEVQGSIANYVAALNQESFADPDGWTATAIMKLNSNPTNVNFNTALEVDDGERVWALHFLGGPGATTTGVFAGGLYLGNGVFEKIDLNTIVDPTDGFHLYQIIFDPNANSGNGAVTYYVDGVNVGTQTRDTSFDTSETRIVFGDNASYDFSSSDSLWSEVRFETGKNIVGAIPGDANCDGLVDSYDASILAANWLGSGSWLQGDFNSDGIIDEADVALLAANWQTPSNSAMTIPEPCSSELLLIGLLLLATLRLSSRKVVCTQTFAR